MKYIDKEGGCKINGSLIITMLNYWCNYLVCAWQFRVIDALKIFSDVKGRIWHSQMATPPVVFNCYVQVEINIIIYMKSSVVSSCPNENEKLFK